jgi:8-oxo-dGTP pyrophosphatase MutT (NUDIX family)
MPQWFRAATLGLLALLVGDVVGIEVPGAADDTRWGAAGCFIPTSDGVVLTIQTRTERIQLPMGKREPGESATATAARETWGETGLDVVVETLVTTYRHGSVLLFLCTLVQPLQDHADLGPVDRAEVAEVVVVDPHTMMSADGKRVTARWRFANDREILGALYDAWKNP